MFRIVIDGAGDMPAGWDTTYGIHMLPLRVRFGEDTFTQGPDFQPADFYRLVKERRIIPKSSLPSIGQVKEFYRSIAQAGDTILSIHISSKLSGTFSTVEAAARELAEEFAITVFDSGAGSVTQGFMAREARMMERAGEALPAVLKRLEFIRRNTTIIFTLDNVEFAYLSGRINRLQNALISALQVKPIVVLRDGLLEMAEKVRTRQRALDRVMTMVCERLNGAKANIAVVHAADLEMARQMVEKVHQMINVQEAVLADVSVPVAANLGPGAIGIIAYPVEEEK